MIEKEEPITERAFRRWMGGVLGMLLGLAFGLTSQWLNRALLPGIPLDQPPFGAVGNTALSTAVGALLGLIAVWPEHGYLGALLSAAVGTLLVQVAVLLTAPERLSALPATVCLFGPVAATILPLAALVRWATDKQVVARLDGLPAWRRVLLPLLLILLIAGVGVFSLCPARARGAMVRMNDIVRTAQAAPDRASLPNPYRAIDAAGYPERLRGPYTLDWQTNDFGIFAIPHPLETEADQVAVLARFETGYAFACLFVPGEPLARCQGYYRWPLAAEGETDND